jgi:hypothetical protein
VIETGQQVAQLLDSYMMMLMRIILDVWLLWPVSTMKLVSTFELYHLFVSMCMKVTAVIFAKILGITKLET